MKVRIVRCQKVGRLRAKSRIVGHKYMSPDHAAVVLRREQVALHLGGKGAAAVGADAAQRHRWKSRHWRQRFARHRKW